MTKTMKFAILGCGNIASFHAEQLKTLKMPN